MGTILIQSPPSICSGISAVPASATREASLHLLDDEVERDTVDLSQLQYLASDSQSL